MTPRRALTARRSWLLETSAQGILMFTSRSKPALLWIALVVLASDHQGYVLAQDVVPPDFEASIVDRTKESQTTSLSMEPALKSARNQAAEKTAEFDVSTRKTMSRGEAELLIPTTLEISYPSSESNSESNSGAADWASEVDLGQELTEGMGTVVLNPEELEVAAKDAREDIWFGDWVGYNPTESDMTWLPGSGDDFGIFSSESYPTLPLSNLSNISTGMGFHFLNGPIATDMPPRLFDFRIAYQSRARRTDSFVLDYRIGVGAFSDFEGSARKGIRFPGHVVGYYQWNQTLMSVLGVEFLDRDDVSLLPVVGWVCRPRKDLVIQAVFPKPQVQVKINDESFLYLSAELGGGTWAIERVTSTNDVVTYSDYRLLFGMADLEPDSASSIEVGWAFSRSLEYRSGLGNYRPDDTFILRLRRLY